MTMLILVARARQQPRKKVIFYNRLLAKLLMMLAYHSAHAKQFFTDVLGFREHCLKIAKFRAKTISHGHRSGDMDNIQRQSRFAQEGHNWFQIMGV